MPPKKTTSKQQQQQQQRQVALQTLFIPDKFVVAAFGVIILATVLPFLAYAPIKERMTTLGLFRPQAEIENIHGLNPIKFIPNTLQCEDLHHHKPSNRLFTACQTGNYRSRLSWFPPINALNDPKSAGEGTIVVVDPTTFESTPLTLDGFSGPLVSHGIDIISSPSSSDTLTIFVVNHLPNPEHYTPTAGVAPAKFPVRSQVEVFTHTIGSSSATWLRSIRHPLIRTPNDIYAISESSFYVTNDHYYRNGALRMIEDLGTQSTTGWTDTVHVAFTSQKSSGAAAAETGVQATIALAKEHNNNGLGHTPDPLDVLLVSATGGVLTRARRNATAPDIHVVERIQFDSCLDNPSYYVDEWATPDNDASGYVVGGLARAVAAANDAQNVTQPIPVMVWHATRDAAYPDEQPRWQKTLVFQDDGYFVRSASAAVIVGIDPATNEGKKQGWLFVTGFISHSMVAAKIDLDRPVRRRYVPKAPGHREL